MDRRGNARQVQPGSTVVPDGGQPRSQSGTRGNSVAEQAAGVSERSAAAGAARGQDRTAQLPSVAEGQTQPRPSSPERNSGSQSPSRGLSPQLSQDMEGFNIPEISQPSAAGQDAPFAGHELYRVLRGSQGDDPLTDELLWEGDFLVSQREFIQKQQEEQMLERLERRMGRVKAEPKSGQAETAAAGGAGAMAPSLAAVAGVAKTGAKFMGLLGKMLPKVPAQGSTEEAAPPSQSLAATVGSQATAAVPQAGMSAAGAVPADKKQVFSSGGVTAGVATAAMLPVSAQLPAAPSTAASAADQVPADASTNKTNDTTSSSAAPLDASAADGAVQVIAVVGLDGAAKVVEKPKAVDGVQQPTELGGLLGHAAEKEKSWVRKMAIKICTHSDFELLVLILIFGNCISLAAYDPMHHESPRNKVLEDIDIALNAAFTVEMILRIVSLGGVFQYLSHPWNAFDGVMVLAGYTTFIPVSGTSGSGLEGIKALRALRAMRPLRTITRFPALRSIVVCFLEAVPLLVSVAAMLFFFLFIFAVAGTELFGDAFHYGCIDPATGNKEDDFAQVADEFGCGARECPAAWPQCKLFDESQSTEVAGFDNVGLSMLSVFQAMTLSNWSFTMYRTMDFLSPAVVIYWFIMIIFGSYFVLNLFLAVLKTKFAKAKNLLDEKRRRKRALKGAKDPKKQNILMRSSGWLKGKISLYVSSKAGSDSLSSHISEAMAKRAGSGSASANFTPRSDITGKSMAMEPSVFAEPSGMSLPNDHRPEAQSEGHATAMISVARASSASGAKSTLHGPEAVKQSGGAGAAGAAVTQGAQPKGNLVRELTRSDSMASGYSGFSAHTGTTGMTGTSGMTGTTGMTGFSTGSLSHECLIAVEEFDETVQDLPRFKRWPLMLQYRTRVLVCSSWFNKVFLAAIVLNTVVLALTFEGMSKEFEKALQQANIAFTCIFTAEMVLKIVGLGPWRYFTDPWSLFDAAVVSFSLVEMIIEIIAHSGAEGVTALRSVRSLRVLRSFRVLRVMKMFKYLESLKMIASVLISSMGSFASIVVLLVLFWMVFSIMGLHVFGGLPLDEPWPNCNDLVNSLILNFNTLNLENFQTQMYSVIRATSYASSAFWLVWVIIGKYILLTLFLAVTLDAFERKYEVDMKKGVRSASIASTLFSTIRKAGTKLKSVASSAVGSSSGRSSILSGVWGGSQGKSGHESMNVVKASHEAETSVVHDAIAAFRVTSESATAINVAEPSTQYSKDGKHSTDGRVNTLNGGDKQISGAAQAGGMLTVDHHGAEAQKARNKHTSDRRRTAEGVRFASQPVGEGWMQSETLLTGWGTGIRQRRRHVGLQQQYGVGDNSTGGSRPSSSSRSSRRVSESRVVSMDTSDSCAEGCPDPAISMQRKQFMTMRRSSSAGSGSCSNSFTLRVDTAAAFAAAAAADALLPLHALPELVDSSSDEDEHDRPDTAGLESADAGVSQGTVLDSPLFWVASAATVHQKQQLKLGKIRHQMAISSHSADSEDPYTWHEFLRTVEAIDYPSRVREQQTVAANVASGTTALQPAGILALLGPIAEGVEPDMGSTAELDGTRTAASEGYVDAPGVPASATRHMAAAGEHRVMSPRPPTAPKPGSAGRSRTPQQVVLDSLEDEIRGLGLQPESTASEQTLPGTNRHRPPSSEGSLELALPPENVGSIWPGLQEADTFELVAPVAKAANEDVGVRKLPDLSEADGSLNGARSEDPSAHQHKPRRQQAHTSARSVGFCIASEADSKTVARSSESGRRTAAASRLDDILQATASSPIPSGSLCGVSSPATVVGFDAGLLLDGGLASVEPSITAKAIKRRRAAAGVSFAADASADTSVHLPGGVEDHNAAAVDVSSQQAAAASGQGKTLTAEHSAVSASSAGTGRRLTRQASMASEAHSDGQASFRSGGSSNWSTTSKGRTRSYPELTGTSLGLFSENNTFRCKVYDTVTARWFDYCMFFVILLNCVAMAYEYPHMSKEAMDGFVLHWADIGFTIIFSTEAVFKIIAFGFKPYISFPQNQVDLLIVVTSLVMAFLNTLDLEVVKALRVLRAIKPLRALTRSAGMQLIFKSLTLSLAAMGNVSIVVLLFFLIFAILGLQLFHGKFWSCNDTTVPNKEACAGTYMLDGVETSREWRNQPFNFDNIGMALVSLFVTSTLNGYTEIMWNAMATPEEPGLQPQPMANWSAFFYFAAFVLVVAYTLMNLYIGVVFYQFSRIRLQSQTGSAFLTDDQTEWVELSRLVFRLKPPEKSPVPVNRIRRRVYYIVQSKQFEFFIMGIIIANSALMATSFYGRPEVMTHVVEALNYAFTCIYVMELLLKVVGLGWTNYWKNNWNKFDFVLVLSSVVDMAITLAMGSHASFLKVQKIMRLLRLARVVKLMRSMKGLRSLFGTLIVSLPAFWNVGALLGLLFFMYAYVGMLLLGNIKRNGGLNEHSNFERFWTAALTLFKIATNDNWTDIMTACMIAPPDCDASAGECGSWVVYPYFISFVLLVSVIMLNLFTAVILESFEAQQEQDRWKLRPDHLDEFVDLWAEYDDGTGTIDPKDLEAMLLRLSPPLGLGATASSTDVLRFVFDLDIPLLAGRVPFQRTAYELVRRCSGAEIPEGMLKDQIDRLVTRAFKNLKADEVLNFSVAVTVMRVQRKWRSRMRAAKLKRKREFRAERGIAPAYADVVAARDVIMKNAVYRRQAGDIRWRPNATCALQWAKAEAVVAAEQAAAALNKVASMRRSSSSTGGVQDTPRWTSLANFKASADDWVHKVAGGMSNFSIGKFLSAAGAISGRASQWAFGSRASSKAVSAVTSRTGSETTSKMTGEPIRG